MDITSAQYVSVLLPDNTTQNASIKATINGVEMFLPISKGNRHYAEIMRQVDAGTLVIAEAE